MTSILTRSMGALLTVAALGACTTPAQRTEVVLITHDSFAVSDQVIAQFEQQTGATLRVLMAGDAGAMVNQAILTRDAPLADALYGIDNTFLTRALDVQLFAPYLPPSLDQVDPALRVDEPAGAVTPIDYGDVCLNYDRAALAGATPPTTLAELTDPEWRGQLVVENPATSSPGLAFMLATIVRFGETGDYTWLDFWRDLRANDLLVTSGWEEAYYGSFSGGAGEGDRALVVSYATSPAAEVFYADPRPDQAPTAVVTDGCFRQVEFAGVLAGTRHEALAQRLIDFMLTPTFQADIPLNMFVFPATDVALPPLFLEHAAPVDEPLTMDPAQIGANRERWIGEWTDVVLH